MDITEKIMEIPEKTEFFQNLWMEYFLRYSAGVM